MNTAPYWQHACIHLRTCDTQMQKLIDNYQGESLQTQGDAFTTLLRALVGQQISIQAAQSVMRKIQNILPHISPQTMLAQSDNTLHSCGLSRAKIRYSREIATYCLQPPNWHNTDPKILKQNLLAIPGIGEWTWQMFAMFYLLLPDEFPLGDLGLRKALVKTYNLSSQDAIAEKPMQTKIEAWRPWRTVAVWHLWRSIDPRPVAY